MVDTEPLQFFHQLHSVDARGDGFHSHGTCEGDYGADQIDIAEVVAHDGFEEFLADPERVKRRAAQVAERRQAAAELVEREAHTELE